MPHAQDAWQGTYFTETLHGPTDSGLIAAHAAPFQFVPDVGPACTTAQALCGSVQVNILNTASSSVVGSVPNAGVGA